MHRHGVDSFPDFGKEWTDGCFSVLVMDGLGGWFGWPRALGFVETCVMSMDVL